MRLVRIFRSAAMKSPRQQRSLKPARPGPTPATQAIGPTPPADWMYVNGVNASTTVQYSAAYALGAPSLVEGVHGSNLSTVWGSARRRISGARQFSGYVGEVLAFSGTLTTAQQQAVEAYLNAKWGLGISPSLLTSALPLTYTGGNLLPTTTNLILGGSGTATLDLDSLNQQVASLSDNGSFVNGVVTTSLASSSSLLTVTPSGSPTTFTGVIQNGSGTMALTINGTGTQILHGTNTYTGATTINNGTLRVNGSLAAGSAVAVGGAAASGSPTLTGSGTINGLVTVAGTVGGVAGTIAGTSGSTLTLHGGLTLGSGSISDFTLNAAHVTNPTALVNITSGSFTGSGSNTDLVYILGSSLAAGTYDLYSATSSTIPVSNFQLMTTAPSPFVYSLQNVSSNQLDLVVTGLLTWTGATNSNWDTTPSDTNWSTGATPAASSYVNGAQVTFADQSLLTPGTNVPNDNSHGGGSGTATVTVQAAGVTPNAVTFTNAGAANGDGGVDYVIQSAISGVGIGGNTGITLTGTGNVTLQGQNTFSGPVNIQAGQLILQSSNALGSTSLVTVSSGGALSLSSSVSASAPLTINGPGLAAGVTLVSPAGALNNASGSNTYSGLISVGSSNAATISSASGATLALTGGIAIGGSSNTLTITGAGGTTVRNAAITGAGNLTYSGSGAGMLSLSIASPSYSGTTTVNSGTLRVTANTAAGTGPVNVSAGGTLGGSGSIGGLVTVAGTGILAPSVGQGPSAATTATFNGGLTLNSGSVLDFNLSSSADNGSPNGLNDHIAVTGALSLSGGVLNITGSSLSPGFYDLIGYTSGSTPSATGWTVGTHPAGYAFTFTTSAFSNQFDLDVTTSSGSATWSSSSNSDYGTSTNWQQGTFPNGAGQIATFGTGTEAVVTLSAGYTVGQLAFNNSSTAYNLSGGGLTLDNSGSGAIVSVAGGTLSPSISTPLTLADSSRSTTFTIATGSSLDMSGPIGESVSLTGQQVVLTGGGTLFMENINTYTGGTTVTNGTLTLVNQGAPGTGSLTFNPSSGNTAVVNVDHTVALNNLSETPGSTGTAQLNIATSKTLTLNQTASANFAGNVSLGTSSSLIVQQNSGNTLTLTGTPTLGNNSSVTVNSGTLALTNNGSPANIPGSATVTVAAGATLQLAGSAAVLSSSVNITTHGTGASGDGALTLTGTTTQTVGVIAGDPLSVPDITSYAGNTTVGDGTNAANLTATQILQNTLTIGAGSTVMLAPSPVLPMVVTATSNAAPAASATSLTADSAATSSSASDSSSDPLLAIQAAIASGSITNATGQMLENRIAAIENLAARNPALNVSLLESRLLATLPSSSLWSSTGAGSSTPLEDSGSSLLALDGSTFGTTSTSSSARQRPPSAPIGRLQRPAPHPVSGTPRPCSSLPPWAASGWRSRPDVEPITRSEPSR